MSRVITFSRVFPAYHPKAGQHTHFVRKILNSIYSEQNPQSMADFCKTNEPIIGRGNLSLFFRNEINTMEIKDKKHHTIRAGNRWKVGDKFSPRVWSGKPYNSKQIIIAPDIEIKKIWDFEIKDHRFIIDGMVKVIDEAILAIAENDGLTIFGFMDWFKFPKEFKGQIICWNENINY